MAEAEHTAMAPDLVPTDSGATPDVQKARDLLFPQLADDQEEPPPAPPADDEPPAPPGDNENPDEPPLPAAVDLAALAERAGLSAKDLDAVVISVEGADQPVTLGDLRQMGEREFAGLASARVALDEYREQFENQMIRSQQELQRAITMAGPGLTPEIIQAAQIQAQQYIENEHSQMVGIKPDWADPEAWTAAHREIADFAAQYGFTPAEIQSTHDHRLKKLVWDFKEQSARIAAGRQQIAEQTAQTTPRDRARTKGNAAKRAEADEAKKPTKQPTRTTGGFTSDQVAAAQAALNKGTQA